MTLHTARAQVRSKGMVEVLQFKATVLPKTSESVYEAQKVQNFWGSISQTPLVSSAFRTASGLIKAGRGLHGYEATRKCSVPTLSPGIGCVLATPLVGVDKFTQCTAIKWSKIFLGHIPLETILTIWQITTSLSNLQCTLQKYPIHIISAV